ncbi:hypothetical protein HDU98_006877 [Podochytrium sp. JEL0797]|nr:hypothetical protein HDU98_006877 [Podochytrium sp. JEL0797]
MSPTPTLLYSAAASSASWRIRAALIHKQIAHEIIPINLTTGQHKLPSYLLKNPSGLVPTLFHNGIYLSQSIAILEYLEEVVPSNPLLPKDPVDRAKVRALADIIACDIHPLQNKSVLEKVSEIQGKEGRDEEFARWAIGRGFVGESLEIPQRD